jgi:hypothetical protein
MAPFLNLIKSRIPEKPTTEDPLPLSSFFLAVDHYHQLSADYKHLQTELASHSELFRLL